MGLLVESLRLTTMKAALVLLLGIAFVASATVYFEEDFSGNWEDRWVLSEDKKKDGTAGVLETASSKHHPDQDDVGLRTTEDARFYQATAKFDEFTNKDKELVFQFTVKHEQKIDCGGGYFKLLPPGFDAKNFNGDSEYNIMFGPDICGYATHRVHTILNYKGKNHLVNKEIKCPDDEKTHLYTLILKPDNSYTVKVDGEDNQSGLIPDHFDVLAPKEIKDPSVSKPKDWVDEPKMADPNAKKPEDWDVPKEIADPDASKPEDWDDDLDGDWEAPMIANPDYKGEWKAPEIDNPDYKGPWIHPTIPNPDYVDDPNIYSYTHGGIGLEIWQVKSGTIFDNILVTDDVKLAEERATQIMKNIKAENAKYEEESKAKAKAAEEAAAAKAAEEADEEGAEDDEEDIKDEL